MVVKRWDLKVTRNGSSHTQKNLFYRRLKVHLWKGYALGLQYFGEESSVVECQMWVWILAPPLTSYDLG